MDARASQDCPGAGAVRSPVPEARAQEQRGKVRTPGPHFQEPQALPVERRVRVEAQGALALRLKARLREPEERVAELMARLEAQEVLPVELRVSLVVPAVEAAEPVAHPQAPLDLLPPEIVERLPS
jgi:hypothetical protein